MFYYTGTWSQYYKNFNSRVTTLLWNSANQDLLILSRDFSSPSDWSISCNTLRIGIRIRSGNLTRSTSSGRTGSATAGKVPVPGSSSWLWPSPTLSCSSASTSTSTTTTRWAASWRRKSSPRSQTSSASSDSSSGSSEPGSWTSGIRDPGWTRSRWIWTWRFYRFETSSIINWQWLFDFEHQNRFIWLFRGR